MLRLVRDCDLFRKVPAEHQEASGRTDGVAIGMRLLSAVAILLLGLAEAQRYLVPLARQRFDLDASMSVHAGEPVKIRVMFNATVHGFPCIDLSLDYQDVMGTRTVDVRTTIFKTRLHKNGSRVGVATRNDPKAAVQNSTGPSIRKQNGSAQCGSCYGALPDSECCNTCSDVLYAYRMKRWSLPRIEEVEQCKKDGKASSVYQPPQMVRFNDYDFDDYLPKLKRISSFPSGGEPRMAAPFRLNFSFKPLELNKLNMAFSSFSTGGLSVSELANGSSDLSWPACVRHNTIIHGYDMSDALLVDLRPHGAKSGCWKNDCSRTDKFDCGAMDTCAEVCHQVKACQWWSFGEEGGHKSCWIRTGQHGWQKRYGLSSGSRDCIPRNGTAGNASGESGGAAAAAAGEATPAPAAADAKASGAGAAANASGSGTGPDLSKLSAAPAAPTPATSNAGVTVDVPAPARRLLSFEDDDDFLGAPRQWDSSPYVPMFFRQDERELERQEQKGESCMFSGFFDTNKVPGNFHIGTHGVASPSYLSYLDGPSPMQQNMEHTIHRLEFVDVETNATLNATQPLDGFESPKAFTFQYYITVTPATLLQEGKPKLDGYQFKAASFVTNELIGPAVFFRLDIDPIRVTYYTDRLRFTQLFVSVCGIVGGCVAVTTMLTRLWEVGAICVGK